MNQQTADGQDQLDRELLQELLDLERGLSEWEVEFVERLSHWTGRFTDKQRETLRRVHEKRIR